MNMSDLVGADDVIMGSRIRDKATLLKELSGEAATRAGLAAPEVLSSLVARERMGSTGLGRGFALPHARLDGLDRMFGLFMKLAHPIDFGAIDGQPVDLVFLLLMPPTSQDHVTALATISRTMRDEERLRHLRKANSAVILHHHLTTIKAV